MKKSLLVASLLAIALTACGKKEEQPAPETAASAPAAATEAASAPAAPAAATEAASAPAAASEAASAPAAASN